MAESPGWYWRRLRNMSASEVAHRVSEKIRRKQSARRSAPLLAFDSATTPLPVFPGLRDRMTQMTARQQAAYAEQWYKTAARVNGGMYEFLGVAWPWQAANPDWFLDPVTGKRWPSEPYCFDIPYRHTRDFGDIKYVWELNRLQYLQPLAALSFVRLDRTLADSCLFQVLDWIERNPPYHGINWNSGIELALRVVSITIVLTFCGERLNEAQKAKIIQSLYQHGYWLARYPSRYSSANNHLIAEGAGLYLLGLVLPETPETLDWRTEGRRILEEETDKQLFPDGVGVEQSPTYTAFSLEFFLLGHYLAQQHGQPFSSGSRDRLLKAGQVLRAMVDKNGNYPRIGDDDEGRVFFTGFNEHSYLLSVLAMLAAAVDDPTPAPPLPMQDFRSLLFGTTAVNNAPAVHRQTFPHGGYTVIREVAAGQESLLVADHGNLGYLSIAAHGHADACALWLHLNGRPVLVDAGTYLYHSGREWRDCFRGTLAHNTLCIAGQDSSTIAGAFNWSHKANARLLQADLTSERWHLTMEHDGYRGRHGCLHRRHVKRLQDNQWQIEDTLPGSTTPLPVTISFLLAPDLIVVHEQDAFHVRDATTAEPVLSIQHHGNLRGAVTHGEASPPLGWYSPHFGKKMPCPHLLFSGTLGVGEKAGFVLTAHASSPQEEAAS